MVSYRDLVKEPREAFEPVVNLLGLRFTDDMIAHIDARESSSTTKVPLDIDPRVRALCRDLEDRLDAVARSHRERAVPVRPRNDPTAGPMEPRPGVGPQNRGAA